MNIMKIERRGYSPNRYSFREEDPEDLDEVEPISPYRVAITPSFFNVTNLLLLEVRTRMKSKQCDEKSGPRDNVFCLDTTYRYLGQAYTQ